MNNKLFDIVIPVGPKDIDLLKLNIKYNSKNIIGYRNIYAVLYDDKVDLPDNVIKINENIFPFSMNDISKFHGTRTRNGWYLQQLIKLYASLVIPNILPRYLVIDADTFFLNPTTFIKDNKCLYNFGNEYRMPYFEHMKKLNSKLEKVYESYSGICHHMMFEQKYILELFNFVEFYHIIHQDYSDKKYENYKFWELFLLYSREHCEGSGASEYEIYFNYMSKYHPNEIEIRGLSWNNVDSLNNLENSEFNYISYHWYLR